MLTVSVSAGRACFKFKIASIDDLISVIFRVEASSLEIRESIVVIVESLRMGLSLCVCPSSARSFSTGPKCRVKACSVSSVCFLTGWFGVNGLGATHGVLMKRRTGLSAATD